MSILHPTPMQHSTPFSFSSFNRPESTSLSLAAHPIQPIYPHSSFILAKRNQTPTSSFVQSSGAETVAGGEEATLHCSHYNPCGCYARKRAASLTNPSAAPSLPNQPLSINFALAQSAPTNRATVMETSASTSSTTFTTCSCSSSSSFQQHEQYYQHQNEEGKVNHPEEYQKIYNHYYNSYTRNVPNKVDCDRSERERERTELQLQLQQDREQPLMELHEPQHHYPKYFHGNNGKATINNNYNSIDTNENVDSNDNNCCKLYEKTNYFNNKYRTNNNETNLARNQKHPDYHDYTHYADNRSSCGSSNNLLDCYPNYSVPSNHAPSPSPPIDSSFSGTRDFYSQLTPSSPLTSSSESSSSSNFRNSSANSHSSAAISNSSSPSYSIALKNHSGLRLPAAPSSQPVTANPEFSTFTLPPQSLYHSFLRHISCETQFPEKAEMSVPSNQFPKLDNPRENSSEDVIEGVSDLLPAAPELVRSFGLLDEQERASAAAAVFSIENEEGNELIPSKQEKPKPSSAQWLQQSQQLLFSSDSAIFNAKPTIFQGENQQQHHHQQLTPQQHYNQPLISPTTAAKNFSIKQEYFPVLPNRSNNDQLTPQQLTIPFNQFSSFEDYSSAIGFNNYFSPSNHSSFNFHPSHSNPHPPTYFTSNDKGAHYYSSEQDPIVTGNTSSYKRIIINTTSVQHFFGEEEKTNSFKYWSESGNDKDCYDYEEKDENRGEEKKNDNEVTVKEEENSPAQELNSIPSPSLIKEPASSSSTVISLKRTNSPPILPIIELLLDQFQQRTSSLSSAFRPSTSIVSTDTGGVVAHSMERTREAGPSVSLSTTTIHDIPAPILPLLSQTMVLPPQLTPAEVQVNSFSAPCALISPGSVQLPPSINAYEESVSSRFPSSFHLLLSEHMNKTLSVIKNNHFSCPLCDRLFSIRSGRSYRLHLWNCIGIRFPQAAAVFRDIRQMKSLCPIDTPFTNGLYAIRLFTRDQAIRRRTSELREDERWYCKNYGCFRVWRKTSYMSIQKHIKNCASGNSNHSCNSAKSKSTNPKSNNSDDNKRANDRNNSNDSNNNIVGTKISKNLSLNSEWTKKRKSYKRITATAENSLSIRPANEFNHLSSDLITTSKTVLELLQLSKDTASDSSPFPSNKKRKINLI